MPQEKKLLEKDEAERLEQDRYLDEALMETFPASDPISPGHVAEHDKSASPLKSR